MRKLILVLFVSLTAFPTIPAAAESIIVGAGAAPAENILKPIKAGFEKATGISLSIITSGPKTALIDLQQGKVQAAAAGLGLKDWLELMKREGSAVKNPEALHDVIIGKDRIIVMLHPSNTVKSLSREQLQGIFSGSIDNWKQVGGADQSIIVVWGAMIQGTNSMFEKSILDGKPLLRDYLQTNTATDIKQHVVANPEAIGIGPSALADGSVSVPETPEIARVITLVTLGKPSAAVQKLIDYINAEGKSVIK